MPLSQLGLAFLCFELPAFFVNACAFLLHCFFNVSSRKRVILSTWKSLYDTQLLKSENKENVTIIEEYIHYP